MNRSTLRRRLAPVAGLLALCLTLSACGGTPPPSASTASAGRATSPATMQLTADAVGNRDHGTQNDAPADAASPAPRPDALAARKIVRHVALSLETKTFDDAVAALLQLVATSGGYVEDQTIGGVSLTDRGNYTERSAEITARIPTEKLDEITASVTGLCNVLSKNERAEDITDHYFDAQAHLDTLHLQEQRLLDILSKADKLEDVITLEQSLSEVRYRIESLTATLQRMDSQVSFSFLNLSLREVVEYQTVTDLPKSFGEQVSDSWHRSLGHLSATLKGMLFFAIEDLPTLLLNLAVLALILRLLWLGTRRLTHGRFPRRIAQNPPSPPPDDDPK